MELPGRNAWRCDGGHVIISDYHSQSITIQNVPREVLKTSDFALFSTLSWNLVDYYNNEWKILFDLSKIMFSCVIVFSLVAA